MKKKLMSIVLALALVLGISAPAMAASPTVAEGTSQMSTLADDDRSAIITALQHIESNKDAFELGKVDFADLYIGNKIQAYEYVENGLEELYYAFPLLYNGKVVALAIKVRGENYQISSALVDKINDASTATISLIYDANAVYLFDGENFTLLGESSTAVVQRESFNDGLPDVNKICVNLCDLGETERLEYVPAMNSRAQTYFACNVKYVPQGSDKNICWAATVACINNYVNGTNLTAADVARAKYGSFYYDKDLMTDEVVKFMNSQYNLNYTYHEYAPSDLVMLNNIQSGRPMYGSFFTTGATRHGATVYGINLVSGYITVMDPAFGSATAYDGGQGFYSYLNPYSGMELGLIYAICYTWQSA